MAKRSIRWARARINGLPPDSATVLMHARPESDTGTTEPSEPLTTEELAARHPNVFAMPKGG